MATAMVWGYGCGYGVLLCVWLYGYGYGVWLYGYGYGRGLWLRLQPRLRCVALWLRLRLWVWLIFFLLECCEEGLWMHEWMKAKLFTRLLERRLRRIICMSKKFEYDACMHMYAWSWVLYKSCEKGYTCHCTYILCVCRYMCMDVCMHTCMDV